MRAALRSVGRTLPAQARTLRPVVFTRGPTRVVVTRHYAQAAFAEKPAPAAAAPVAPVDAVETIDLANDDKPKGELTIRFADLKGRIRYPLWKAITVKRVFLSPRSVLKLD